MKSGLNKMKKQTLDRKPFLSVLQGDVLDTPPFWLMRQAGRYLPEYRELRKTAGGFLDLVYNPDFAIEVTMQPLRRYDMDAAILFSDILVIPQALGQHLEFVAGEGPKLDAVRDSQAIEALNYNPEKLNPVYETVAGLRRQMVAEGFDQTALIGFAGAPWTVATYMVEGGGSKTFEKVKALAYRQPAIFENLIEKITAGTIDYLGRQIEAGAEAIQIFDSWAGVLEENQYRRWVIEPTKKIVSALQKKHPQTPIIGFPKGSGFLYKDYARDTGVTALGLDAQVPLRFAQELQKTIPVQGNLDNVCLLAGGQTMKDAVQRILTALGGGPFIFNLGHGVIKETPPEHVEELSQIIKSWQKK